MKNFSSKASFIFIFVTMLAVFTDVNVTLGNGSNIVEIDIIALNDFHGALVSSGPNDLNPGAVKIVHAVLHEASQNPNTLVLAAGDMYMGTALSNLFYGEPVSQMLKLINVDASAVGNHEFTWGVEQIQLWEEAEGAPFLSANIYDTYTNQPVTWAKPYIIRELDGVNVGLLGLTTVETGYKTRAENIAGLEFKDPVEIAEIYVPILKEEGADIVVLLTHIGSFQDTETGIITMEEGTEGLTLIDHVDAIITGHSHRGVAGELNGVPVVQGMHNGRALARLNFVYDKDNKQILEINPYLDLLHERRHDIEEHQGMKDLLDNYIEEIEPMLQEIVGITLHDLPHSRSELSILGQWTSELMIKASGADVAFTNAGGLRTGIPAGEITMGKLIEVMPFDNAVILVELTGAQIKEVLEYGIDNTEFGQVQFAGIIVEYFEGEEEGRKVNSIYLNNGQPLDLNQTYSVVTNSFMQEGGDGFKTFLDTTIIKDIGFLRDILVEGFLETEILEYTPGNILVPVSNELILNSNIMEMGTLVNRSHVIITGDTLWSLALEYGTTVDEIVAHNNILNPDLIYVNHIIIIP